MVWLWFGVVWRGFVFLSNGLTCCWVALENSWVNCAAWTLWKFIRQSVLQHCVENTDLLKEEVHADIQVAITDGKKIKCKIFKRSDS